jgi:hypothetical protein
VDEQDKMHDSPGDFALDEPLPPGATEPVDVVQVRADDALIAALSTSDDLHIDDPIDERLAGLLRAWRQDVDAEPERPVVDVPAAMAALVAAPRAPQRRRSPFGPLATAAAVLVIAFIGLGVAAHSSQPGDPLWTVTKVLYSDKAKSVEAKVTVAEKLDQARQALRAGNPTAAMIFLKQAEQQLVVVAPEDGRQQLATEATNLKAVIDPSSSPTSDPQTAAPPPASPAPEPTDAATPSDLTSPITPPPSASSSPSPTTPPPPTASPTVESTAAGTPGEANPKAGAEVPPAESPEPPVGDAEPSTAG